MGRQNGSFDSKIQQFTRTFNNAFAADRKKYSSPQPLCLSMQKKMALSVHTKYTNMNKEGRNILPSFQMAHTLVDFFLDFLNLFYSMYEI